MNVIEPGMRGAAALSGRRLVTATALGAGVGLVAAFDGAIAHAFDWLWFAQQVPYALSLLVLAAALAGALVARHRTLLWREQFALTTVAIVYSLHLMALDVGPINPLNVLIVLMCMLWLLHRCVDHTAPWSPSGLFHLSVLFMACVLASALNQDFIDIFRGLLNMLPKLVLVLILTDILDDRQQVDLAVRALIASSAIAAVVGMVQSSLYFGYQLELNLMGPDAPRYVPIAGVTVLRASGLHSGPHFYAQPLAVAALIALFLAGTAHGWRRAWFGGAAFAALVGVILSVARNQWVGVFFGLILLPLVARPRLTLTLWVPLGFGLFAVGMASGLLPWAVRALLDINVSSGTARVELFGAGIRALMEHPLNGVGIGNFPSYFPTNERDPVHNAVIEVGSELGAVGSLVFVTALAWVAARLVNGIRAAADPHARNQLKALLVGYLCMLVEIQFDLMAYSEFVWFYLVLADSAVRVALRESSGKATMAPEQQGSGPRLGSFGPEI